MTATLPTATDPRSGATSTVPAEAGATAPSAARPAPHGAPARPLVRFRSSRPDLLLCGALLLVIVLVQGWNITNFPTLSDDEGTYLAQAWAVQQGDGLAHYTYWYDHPPLGWIQVAALTYLPSLFVPDWMTVAPMRFSMLAVSAASSVLLYVLARRLWLPRWAAGLAMALFGLSPLSVVLQREIFLDNLAVMWMLLAFCLAASPNRHLWHHFASGLAAATAVLTKETMLVVLPALLVTMWRHSHRDTRKFAVTGAITACVLIGLSYPLYALLNGELLPGSGHVSLIDGITYQMGREGSGFILTPGSGSNGVFRSWLYYDTVLPLGGLAGAVLLLATVRRSVTARALAGPALAAVILAAVAMRPSGYLPAMYVIQALPFLALVLAGGAASITHAVLSRRRAPGEPRPRVWARRALIAVLAVSAAVYVLPRWYDGNRTALTVDANAPYRQAAAWLGSEVADPANTRVLLDDALWLDAVHQGFEPGLGAIWFYKADLDPAVTRTLPRGWQDIDYVVSSPTVRRDAVNLPNVKAALEHSAVVAVFGSGEDRIEIRRTDRTDRTDRAGGAGRTSGS
ncbi:phospholipid carrier-dependent glycosyltransferase [Streptomyces sp. NBC_00160]|uniref:ArnT family glycosyltransferase n=1 Tax=Streptomyces TaxID=1883 RepID=UPI00207A6120|nr:MULTISPECIES: phospholipid carrier-dependent glycosyltransferase [Streptomyces]MCM9081478.1 phospholipid carrier-dependent glycosyltransferase [Streptomyces spororaveus]MCX5304072.1 phospholipid carrier-dependent glycosyltransferase [Streptomyces sp. NBC_00160]